MEDITPYRVTTGTLQIGDISHMVTVRSVSRALNKVKIKLTSEQLQCLANMVASQLAIAGYVKGHLLLSHLREVYLLNLKLQRKRLTQSGHVKLSLTMTEASALSTCLDTLEFNSRAIYERSLRFYVIMEIDKQTV